MRQLLFLAVLATAAACGPATPDSAPARTANPTERRVFIAGIENELRQATAPLANRSRADELVGLYLAYVRDLPQDSLAPVYLFRAADLSRGIRDYSRATELWEKVHTTYPDYARAPDALFLVALTTDQDIGDRNEALSLYRRFLKAYPQHALAKDAQLLLTYLEEGKTPENLVKEFEQRQR